jgi:hypothetical protein
MGLQADASTPSPLLLLATGAGVVVIGSPGEQGEGWSLQHPVYPERSVLCNVGISLPSREGVCPTMVSS